MGLSISLNPRKNIQNEPTLFNIGELYPIRRMPP
jgi:hypothetical protein